MTKSPLDPSALAASLDAAKGGSPEAVGGQHSPTTLRDLDMRIARDGTWFYHGSPITRKPLVRLFASVLRRDDDGAYWLVTPAEKGRVRVDDAPFVAVEVTAAGRGETQTLRFRTNLDDEVTAGAGHPIRVETDPASGEPAPYVLVRDRLEALIVRAVFYELVELGTEHHVNGVETLGVWSAGQFFPIGPAPEAA